MRLMLVFGALMVLTDRPARLLEALEPLPKIPVMPRYQRQHQREGWLTSYSMWLWAIYSGIFFCIGFDLAAVMWS